MSEAMPDQPLRRLFGGAPMALEGVRVIDASTMQASPASAAYLSDFGADVIKVEHPKGDPLRDIGQKKDGLSMWWALLSRNKRCVTLNLSKPEGQAIFKQLVATADVVMENYRPGTMERWGLGYEELSALNPKLIMVRTTGFGQTGPYRNRPGFGTAAEAMSGLAHITGDPNGPPTLPSYGTADAVAGVFGALGTMYALYHRDANGTGQGQCIDMSLFEPLFTLLGAQPLVFDQLGIVPTRTGNRTETAAARNIYRAKDGRWVGVSAVTTPVLQRVMRLVGREDVIQAPWFQTMEGRIAHHDELDEMIGGWIAEHPTEEIVEAFERFEAVVAPVYNIADAFGDAQFIARETITTVGDERLGPARTQNPVPRLSKTPGRVRFLGPQLGAHNHEIFVGELGYQDSDLETWRQAGII